MLLWYSIGSQLLTLMNFVPVVISDMITAEAIRAKLDGFLWLQRLVLHKGQSKRCEGRQLVTNRSPASVFIQKKLSVQNLNCFIVPIQPQNAFIWIQIALIEPSRHSSWMQKLVLLRLRQLIQHVDMSHYPKFTKFMLYIYIDTKSNFAFSKFTCCSVLAVGCSVAFLNCSVPDIFKAI